MKTSHRIRSSVYDFYAHFPYFLSYIGTDLNYASIHLNYIFEIIYSIDQPFETYEKPTKDLKLPYQNIEKQPIVGHPEPKKVSKYSTQ